MGRPQARYVFIFISVWAIRLTACFFLFTGAATVYPSHASGAVVALVDENTGSDAELAAEAFRRLNLGVVVGTRTWGGLLTTSDSFKLVDG